MRFTNFVNELFTNYKIEKWNEKKQCWEHQKGYINMNETRIDYNYLLKNCKGIYRMIKIIEIDER